MKCTLILIAAVSALNCDQGSTMSGQCEQYSIFLANDDSWHGETTYSESDTMVANMACYDGADTCYTSTFEAKGGDCGSCKFVHSRCLGDTGGGFSKSIFKDHTCNGFNSGATKNMQAFRDTTYDLCATLVESCAKPITGKCTGNTATSEADHVCASPYGALKADSATIDGKITSMANNWDDVCCERITGKCTGNTAPKLTHPTWDGYSQADHVCASPYGALKADSATIDGTTPEVCCETITGKCTGNTATSEADHVCASPYGALKADSATIDGTTPEVCCEITVTAKIEVTGTTEASLVANTQAQSDLILAVSNLSGVDKFLVSLTVIGNTNLNTRRLQDKLTLTFELKTDSVEAARSLQQKLESMPASSINEILNAGATGIEVAGSPKATISGETIAPTKAPTKTPTKNPTKAPTKTDKVFSGAESAQSTFASMAVAVAVAVQFL